MTRRVFITLLTVFFGVRGLALAPQSPPPAVPPAHWVPLTARSTEKHLAKGHMGSFKMMQFQGIYARTASGITYSRVGNLSGHDPWGRSRPDVALITDRPRHVQWKIDFHEKIVLHWDLAKDNPEFAEQPMTREVFEKMHAQDVSLGHRVISGMACDGYLVRDEENASKAYRHERWYAPALNFLLIRSRVSNPDGSITTQALIDIHTGQEPDPVLFRFPEGFKVMK